MRRLVQRQAASYPAVLQLIQANPQGGYARLHINDPEGSAAAVQCAGVCANDVLFLMDVLRIATRAGGCQPLNVSTRRLKKC